MPPKACPHCGFVNFDISAYCPRCSRPLATPPGSDTDVTRVPQPHRPRDAGTSPMPKALQARHLAQRLQNSRPAHIQTDISSPSPDAKTVIRHMEPKRDIPVRLPHVTRLWLAGAIDLAAVLSLLAGLAWLADALLGGAPVAAKDGLLETAAQWLQQRPEFCKRLVALGGVVAWLYSLAGSRTGRTVGRHLCGLCVVSNSGSPLSWGAAAARAALSLLSLLCVGAGFFWAVVDGRRRAWHDIVTRSQTVVGATKA